jgi:hypothetical protein
VKTSRFAWILPVAAIVAASTIVGRNRVRAAQLEGELGASRAESMELHRLQSERRKLESEQPAPEERRRLDDQHAALLALRARLAELQRDAPQAHEEPAQLPAMDWTYAGNQTPRAAIESVLWAASHGDVDKLAGLLGFSPEVRAQADAMYSSLPAASQQEYGSTEKVVATLLAGNFPKDASAMTILSDREWDEDAAISMSVDHSEGKSKTNVFRFHHAPGGWQLLVPANMMVDFATTLQGEQKLIE